jgi:hypothetical protein
MLEASLLEIDVLGEKISGINKILNWRSSSGLQTQLVSWN